MDWIYMGGVDINLDIFVAFNNSAFVDHQLNVFLYVS